MIDLSKLPQPEPAAGIKAYEAERKARLASEPRCRENWERYLASRGAGWCDEVDYLPVRLDVENVSRCNFACTMCAVSKWPHRRRAADMSLEAFRALIDEQYGLTEIKLNGIGEPLLQGEDFFAMIRYARERSIWVRVTTNGSLLGVNENYRKLLDAGVNEVDISIDGVSKHVFETIRVGSNFERVLDGCRKYNEYARTCGRPSAKMWTLVQRENERALYAHVDLAGRTGFRHLVFSLSLHGWGDPKLALRNRTVEIELNQSYLEDLAALGKRLGVRVAFWSVAAKFDASSPETLCPWPFGRAVVTSDSRTVPCCMIGSPDACEIGKGKQFSENWHGAEYRAFRQAHLNGKIPAVCMGCYK